MTQLNAELRRLRLLQRLDGDGGRDGERGAAEHGLHNGGDGIHAIAQAIRKYEGGSRLRVLQTHASWVFLSDRHAWKWKKGSPGVPAGAFARRQRIACEKELALNRRLAPSVYLGVVALYQSDTGELQFEPAGQPRDWLVWMRRLPDDRSLEAVLRRAVQTGTGLERRLPIATVGQVLAQFHARSPAPPVAAAVLRARLLRALRLDGRWLLRRRYRLPLACAGALLQTLRRQAMQLAPAMLARAGSGLIVDGHGDLRAEHVYLVDEVEIIDSLDFSEALRIQDGADEAAFLALECERLGAGLAAKRLLGSYLQARQDRISSRLLDFYQACRAVTRARLAIAHLDEPRYRHQRRHRLRALEYLALALRHGQPQDRRRRCRRLASTWRRAPALTT